MRTKTCTDIRYIETKIRIPTEKWPGKCHQIAIAIEKAEIVEGAVRYGHYLGPVAKGSLFEGRANAGFCRHGWIELDYYDALSAPLIYDPTRWVFENVRPYIFIGEDHDGFYDAGGNVLRAMMQKLPPIPAESERTHVFPRLRPVTDMIGDPPYSFGQLMWLANLSLSVLGDDAKMIYQALIAMQKGSTIPIDNRRLILGEEEVAAEHGRRQELRKKQRNAKREYDHTWLLDNIKMLLDQTPKHDRTSCTDANPTNGAYGKGQFGCRRCLFLQLQQSEFNEEFVVEIQPKYDPIEP